MNQGRVASDELDTAMGSVNDWPPGTVLLEDAGTRTSRESHQIILQPRPSTDPNDPLNWPNRRKYINFALVCLYSAMVSQFTSSATPTWGPMQEELGHTDAQLNNSYAVGCAFLGLGAVFLTPFSLKYGRRPLYLFSTLVQCLVAVWSAKQTTYADLLLINVVQCGFGALGEVMAQMTIADVFFVHQRGRLNSTYVWIWKVAAPLGSILSGFITLRSGWRWVWWGNAIWIGGLTLLTAFFYDETKFSVLTESEPQTTVVGGNFTPVQACSGQQINSPSLGLPEDLDKKGDAKRSMQDDAIAPSQVTALHTIEIDESIPAKTYWQRLSLTAGTSRGDGIGFYLRHLYQPFILVTTIPGVAYTALVYGILIALNDVMSTSIATYMKKPPYNFNSAQVGLMSMPRIIGVTLGCVVGGPLSDWLVVFLARRNKGVYQPEMRLWCFCIFLPLIPAGAVLAGIGLGNGLPWPFIAVGVALYNMGVSPVRSVVLTYLTDSYQDIIGDALVGVTFVRNTFSTIFIFALTPWIERIGITNVFVTILVIATVIIAFFLVLLRWGSRFRAQSANRYHFYAARQHRGRL